MEGKKVVLNKKEKSFTKETLEKMDKTELVQQVLRFQAYSLQLKNLLNKRLSQNDSHDEEMENILEGCFDKNKKVIDRVQKRKFDFDNMHKRRILLKFLYFGWDYEGYPVQENTHNTIENIIFNALTRTCLIESRQSCNYHRCGRTDKEVSAFSQVISLDVRSKFPESEQFDAEKLKQEIQYCTLLNRMLPKDIKCVAWMPLKSNTFSARFDCSGRTYRYYFPKSCLNVEKMKEACKLLQRHSDFRNLCKLDVNNGVTNYIRRVEKVSIESCVPGVNDSGYNMLYLEIKANAFLWHQIRCMVSILFLIGTEKEKPEVINELFDLEKNPRKPQYQLAAGFPLNLFHVEYGKKKSSQLPSVSNNSENSENIESETADWIYDLENLSKTIEILQEVWTENNIKTTMVKDVIDHIESLRRNNFPSSQDIDFQVYTLLAEFKAKNYTPLMKRKTCGSLDERIQYFVKKRKLLIKDDDMSQGLQPNEQLEECS